MMRGWRCSLLVGVSLLSGCTLFGPAVAHVRLIASAPVSARLGDSVAVRVTLENLAEVPVWFEGNECPRRIRVVGPNGEEAGPAFRTLVCRAYSLRVRVDPGSSHEVVRYWQARTHGPRGEPIVVRPGRYRIEPVVGVDGTANGYRVVVRYVVATISVVE